MIKGVLFLVALGWLLLNLAGFVWALFEHEGPHSVVHFLLIIVFGVAAFLLRPWGRGKTPVRHDSKFELMQDEISELRRELDNKQEGLDFAEQLLAKRPSEQPVDIERKQSS